MRRLRLFKKYRNFFVKDIEQPVLVFAMWNKSAGKYYPCCIQGEVDEKRKTVPVYFLHNEKEKVVHACDIIYHHSNLMMKKASFKKRGKVYMGIVYGNDSRN